MPSFTVQKLQDPESVFLKPKNIFDQKEVHFIFVLSQNKENNSISSIRQNGKADLQNKLELSVKNENSFQTMRLKPMKQKTKHGIVEILKDGHLNLDFNGEKYLIDISEDGSVVCILF